MPSFYEEKIFESGLTVEDAETLKIEILSAMESRTLSKHNKKEPALKLNYHTPRGEILSDLPGVEPYWRLRYFDIKKEKEPEPEGFGKQTKKTKFQRYSNLPRTIPVAYWPLNFDWNPVLEDFTRSVIIVEGELKAAKGCKEGFATIALAGVNSWLSRKRGSLFLDSLKYLEYKRRDIYICFDDDYISKKAMISTMTVLARELTSRGAYVHIVTLPPVPILKKAGEKTGLDDFLVYSGKDAVENFNVLLSNAQPIGLVDPLFDLNKEYVILSSPTCVYNKYTEAKHKTDSFKNLLEADKRSLVRIPKAAKKGDENAEYEYKDMKVASEWLSWPIHERCDSLVYAPGQGEYVQKTIRGKEYEDYNCWPGWGAKPVEGDVSLFIALIDFLFQDAKPQDKEWFLQWLAYPIQHPGAKLYTACAIHGTLQGTGKTLVGYTVGGIYGDNYKEVDQAALEADFHKPFMNRQFILGDEITGSEQRKFGDKLKRYITGHEILINDKFVPQYYITNCINFYFTSNHPSAFYLEDTDRRFFIHQTPHKKLSREFYKKYDMWYSTQCAPKTTRPEAMNALMHYFMNFDTSSFDPHAAAPITQSKEIMQELGKSDLSFWVQQARLHPNETLGGSGRDIFNSSELLLLYDPMEKKRVTANGMARELMNSSILKCNGGKNITANNKVCRYYILRNEEKWLKASTSEIIDHITNNPAFTNEQSKY